MTIKDIAYTKISLAELEALRAENQAAWNKVDELDERLRKETVFRDFMTVTALCWLRSIAPEMLMPDVRAAKDPTP
jgi:hypothetical protein